MSTNALVTFTGNHCVYLEKKTKIMSNECIASQTWESIRSMLMMLALFPFAPEVVGGVKGWGKGGGDNAKRLALPYPSQKECPGMK